MAQDTAGPEGAAKAIASAKAALSEANKKFPSAHQTPVHSDAAKASYQLPRKQRLNETSAAKEPIGETSAGEINRTLNEKEEAGKQLDQMNIPH